MKNIAELTGVLHQIVDQKKEEEKWLEIELKLKFILIWNMGLRKRNDLDKEEDFKKFEGIFGKEICIKYGGVLRDLYKKGVEIINNNNSSPSQVHIDVRVALEEFKR